MPPVGWSAAAATCSCSASRRPREGSPAFSPVVRSRPRRWPSHGLLEYVDSGTDAVTEARHDERLRHSSAPRAVPCRTCAEQFCAASVARRTCLAQVVKVAGPVVRRLLGAGQEAAAGSRRRGRRRQRLRIRPTQSPQAILEPWLPRRRHSRATTLQPQPAGAQPQLRRNSHSRAATAADATPHPQRRRRLGPAAPATGSRTATPPSSRPFIFGIDDALLASLAGPISSRSRVLPQLDERREPEAPRDEAGQNKLDRRHHRRHQPAAAAGQLVQAQSSASRAGPAARWRDLTQLAELLQQAGRPGAPPAAAVDGRRRGDAERRVPVPRDPCALSQPRGRSPSSPRRRSSGTARRSCSSRRASRCSSRCSSPSPSRRRRRRCRRRSSSVVVKDAASQTVLAEKVVEAEGSARRTRTVACRSRRRSSRAPPVNRRSPARRAALADAKRRGAQGARLGSRSSSSTATSSSSGPGAAGDGARADRHDAVPAVLEQGLGVADAGRGAERAARSSSGSST